MRHLHGRITALSLAVTCAYGLNGWSARAQSATAHADILGVRLGDSADTAKKTIIASFPAAQVLDVPTTLNANGHQQVYTIGTLFDISSAAENQSNAATEANAKQQVQANAAAGLSTGTGLDKIVTETGDFGHDRISITWNSGDGVASNIFGIGRAKEFRADQRPSTTETTASLVAKYGKPTFEFKEAPRDHYLYWAANSGFDRSKCIKVPYKSALLYEDAGFAAMNIMQMAANIMGIDFVGRVNNFHNHNPLSDVSKCGVVLRAQIWTTDDGLYVNQLNESLVDMTGGQSALTQLANAFFNGITPPKPGPQPKL